MSEKLCELRKKGGGGGKYTETSLWTNPSPTASSFANQDVTLSDSLTNYEYVKIVYGYVPTDLGSFSTIYKVSEFVNTSAPATYGFSGVVNVTHKSNGLFYDRRILYKNVNTITFGSAFAYKNNGTASVSNGAAIPLEILGLNELAQGKTNQTILWTNPSPTSQFAAQTISLDLSEYDAIILKCSSVNTNTLPTVYPTNICAQQYIPIPYGTAGASTYRISYGLGYVGSESFNSNRETVVTTSGVTFGGGYRNYSAGNQYAIPIQIIGVKIS